VAGRRRASSELAVNRNIGHYTAATGDVAVSAIALCGLRLPLTGRLTLPGQTCQVSRISRETHAFSMSLTLSLRTVEISRVFLLNEKQYF